MIIIPIIGLFFGFLLKKEFLGFDENNILGALYLPPENSRFFFNNDLFTDLENEISNKCSNFKYVYLAGDTNSRTGTLRDFFPVDSYLNDFFLIDADSQAHLNKYSVLIFIYTARKENMWPQK